MTFWRCDAEVTSSFVIVGVLFLRIVLTKLCKLWSFLYSSRIKCTYMHKIYCIKRLPVQCQCRRYQLSNSFYFYIATKSPVLSLDVLVISSLLCVIVFKLYWERCRSGRYDCNAWYDYTAVIGPAQDKCAQVCLINELIIITRGFYPYTQWTQLTSSER